MNEPEPVVVGYIRDRPGEVTAKQMGAMQERILAHARRTGLVVGYLYIEKDSVSQSAFNSAISRFGPTGPRYFLVPGSDHLRHVATLNDMPTLSVVEDLTALGIEVLIVA